MSERTEFIVVSEMPALTEHVVAGYNNAGPLQTYETFDVSGDMSEMREAADDREHQKQLFLTDDIRNPRLNFCPNFHKERDSRRQLYTLTQAQLNLLETDNQDKVALSNEDELLASMLQLRLKEINFLETAAVVAEGNLSEEERSDCVGILKWNARDCYGMPDRDETLTLIDKRLAKALDIVEQPEHPAHDIAQWLLEQMHMPLY
ncbi:MAG TPA: hypothetical protein VK983_02800 [Candidatus Limnocylindrales bacterium]|nr:hypothetical protein [Candidatus Limnocylindrales bacterium]